MAATSAAEFTGHTALGDVSTGEYALAGFQSLMWGLGSVSSLNALRGAKGPGLLQTANAAVQVGFGAQLVYDSAIISRDIIALNADIAAANSAGNYGLADELTAERNGLGLTLANNAAMMTHMALGASRTANESKARNEEVQMLRDTYASFVDGVGRGDLASVRDSLAALGQQELARAVDGFSKSLGEERIPPEQLAGMRSFIDKLRAPGSPTGLVGLGLLLDSKLGAKMELLSPETVRLAGEAAAISAPAQAGELARPALPDAALQIAEEKFQLAAMRGALTPEEAELYRNTPYESLPFEVKVKIGAASGPEAVLITQKNPDLAFLLSDNPSADFLKSQGLTLNGYWAGEFERALPALTEGLGLTAREQAMLSETIEFFRNVPDKDYHSLRHTVAAAITARQLAQVEGFPAELAFGAGLGHDMGFIDPTLTANEPLGARHTTDMLRRHGFSDAEIAIADAMVRGTAVRPDFAAGHFVPMGLDMEGNFAGKPYSYWAGMMRDADGYSRMGFLSDVSTLQLVREFNTTPDKFAKVFSPFIGTEFESSSARSMYEPLRQAAAENFGTFLSYIEGGGTPTEQLQRVQAGLLEGRVRLSDIEFTILESRYGAGAAPEAQQALQKVRDLRNITVTAAQAEGIAAYSGVLPFEGKTGGDIAQSWALPNGDLLTIQVDVVGHGERSEGYRPVMEEAAAATRSWFDAEVRAGRSPSTATALERFGDELSSRSTEEMLSADVLISVLGRNGTFRYSSAGGSEWGIYAIDPVADRVEQLVVPAGKKIYANKEMAADIPGGYEEQSVAIGNRYILTTSDGMVDTLRQQNTLPARAEEFLLSSLNFSDRSPSSLRASVLSSLSSRGPVDDLSVAIFSMAMEPAGVARTGVLGPAVMAPLEIAEAPAGRRGALPYLEGLLSPAEIGQMQNFRAQAGENHGFRTDYLKFMRDMKESTLMLIDPTAPGASQRALQVGTWFDAQMDFSKQPTGLVGQRAGFVRFSEAATKRLENLSDLRTAKLEWAVLAAVADGPLPFKQMMEKVIGYYETPLSRSEMPDQAGPLEVKRMTQELAKLRYLEADNDIIRLTRKGRGQLDALTGTRGGGVIDPRSIGVTFMPDVTEGTPPTMGGGRGAAEMQALTPEQLAVQQRGAAARAQYSPSPAETALLKQADDYIRREKRGDFPMGPDSYVEMARNSLEAGIASYPSNPALYTKLIIAYGLEGRANEALEVFEDAKGNGAADAGTYLAITQGLYAKAGGLSRAEKPTIYRDIVEIYNNSPSEIKAEAQFGLSALDSLRHLAGLSGDRHQQASYRNDAVAVWKRLQASDASIDMKLRADASLGLILQRGIAPNDTEAAVKLMRRDFEALQRSSAG
ncbi:MAG: hypothetical protein WC759_05060, partial [Candidatus Micrarchaeia archaeon]